MNQTQQNIKDTLDIDLMNTLAADIVGYTKRSKWEKVLFGYDGFMVYADYNFETDTFEYTGDLRFVFFELAYQFANDIRRLNYARIMAGKE